MSADGSHIDDPEGPRKAPPTVLAAQQFALHAQVQRVLTASGQADPANSVVFAEALENLVQEHLRQYRGRTSTAEPNPAASQTAEPGHPNEFDPAFTTGAGPTPTARGARLFRTDERAACLYNRSVLNRNVTDLVVLRWLDVLQGDPCPRNELIDKLSLTFTIESPRSFLLRLDDLLEAGHIYWDKGRRGHFPPLTITPKGSAFCGQLMRREVRRLSRDQYNCLATYLPWLGLEPIAGDSKPEV